MPTEHERTCWHEAGHCCSLLVQGVPVLAVDTVGDATRGGYVLHEHQITDRDSAIKRAKSIMAAWLEEHDGFADLPAWPLNSRAITSTDERRLASICEYLGWTERDYENLIADTCTLLVSEPYRILFQAVTGALDYTPRLDRRWLSGLLNLTVRKLEE